jgi:hypothetical protein
MERNVEMQNAPVGMFDDEEAVQSAEIKVGNDEEVEHSNGFASEKCAIQWLCFRPARA